MIRAKINGQSIEAPMGTTILEACRQNGIYVPTFCSHPSLPPVGECGTCTVQIGENRYVRSCVTRIENGMEINTNSSELRNKSKDNFLKFIKGPIGPSTPDIEDLFIYFSGRDPMANDKSLKSLYGSDYEPSSNVAVSFDPTKCVDCKLCIRECQTVQLIDAIAPDHQYRDCCIKCGQCASVCPVHAITETTSIPAVMQAITAGKIMVIQFAPSVRASIAESFGEAIGAQCTGKMISAARAMGFKYVFDINYGADMTIMEEGTELIKRIQSGGVLPQFTSCCPGWVNFVEKNHPELIPNLSTSKSPHMMTGTMIKTYFAEQILKIDPSQIFLVSCMPCTAKKDEIVRPQHKGCVDAVITAREFSKMIGNFGLDWSALEQSNFDSLFGECSGGGAIFGVTGGVMEASVRFVSEKLTGRNLGPVTFEGLRGFDGIKTASFNIAGTPLKVAVCSGVGHAKELIDAGKHREFDFIEVMACPGGCIGGGGQPYLKRNQSLGGRAQTLYKLDRQLMAQGKVCASENEGLAKLYAEYIGEPGGERAEQLLHTSYAPQVQLFYANYRSYSHVK